jgi:hypothetical protein
MDEQPRGFECRVHTLVLLVGFDNHMPLGEFLGYAFDVHRSSPKGGAILTVEHQCHSAVVVLGSYQVAFLT